VAADQVSQRLLQQAQKIAASGSTVLIRGDAGVGKNLLASLIHYLGPAPDQPLLRLACAELPPQLIEAELFGGESGMGATRGCLELAASGTLVLDEVAALPMPVQAKLLRVIEEARLERRGELIGIHARIVALTSIDLERAIARRTFREDLYFRLNVLPLMVPALRERPDDIPALAGHFLRLLTEVHRKPQLRLSAAALSALCAYEYPGNVRELKNIVERSVLDATPPDLLLQDLPPHLRDASRQAARSKISLAELERAYIAEVLDSTGGKKTQAANILGISRKTLLEKRKRYGLG
jgi:DNA-binding NtrC family response regulator